MRQVGATLHRGAQATHYRGLSRCRAQAPDAQAQQLWLTGLVAPRHVGSSQTRARTHVPCIGRQILNHCATREALPCYFDYCSFIVLSEIRLCLLICSFSSGLLCQFWSLMVPYNFQNVYIKCLPMIQSKKFYHHLFDSASHVI